MSEAGETTPARPEKSPAAFRTISEVAEDLDLPTHVLRFWESKFPQLKPLKRGGGRRYYRPEDILLLRRIRQCLYQDGYTIRGVQKLLNSASEPAAAASDRAAAPSLFPLEAPVDGLIPPAGPMEHDQHPEKPARRTRQRTAKSGQTARQEFSAALEEIRRDLHEARAALTELLKRPNEP